MRIKYAATVAMGVAAAMPLLGGTAHAQSIRPTRADFDDPIVAAAPATAATPVPSSTTIKQVPSSTWTVRSGQDLWQIGQDVNIPWPTLAATNKLNNPALIFPGESLLVPRGATAVPRVATTEPATTQATTWRSAAVVSAPSSAPRVVAPTPSPAGPGAGTVTATGAIPGGLLGKIAACESTDNPHAVSPSGTYFGLYQFNMATWAANGGTGNPAQASVAQQTAVAQRLLAARGTSPWPVCG